MRNISQNKVIMEDINCTAIQTATGHPQNMLQHLHADSDFYRYATNMDCL